MLQLTEPVIERRLDLTDAVRRVRGEFLEMPGLCLTPAQAARLWAFDAPFCNQVLASLVDAHFLVHSRGAFVRAEGRI